MSLAYAAFVDARARALNGDVEAAIDEIDDDLGLRPHWRKLLAGAGPTGILDRSKRVAYFRGSTRIVPDPVRERGGPLAAPVPESRVERPAPGVSRETSRRG